MDESYKAQLEKLAEKGVKYRILSDRELKDFENTVQYNLIQQDWIKDQEAKGSSIACNSAKSRYWETNRFNTCNSFSER